jgi:hypothetical protein
LEEKMKKFDSKEELDLFLRSKHRPYDVDTHWQMEDMEYQFPIWTEFLGTTHLGAAFKVRNREQMLALKQIFMDL